MFLSLSDGRYCILVAEFITPVAPLVQLVNSLKFKTIFRKLIFLDTISNVKTH